MEATSGMQANYLRKLKLVDWGWVKSKYVRQVLGIDCLKDLLYCLHQLSSLPMKVNNLTTNQTQNKWNTTLLDAIRPVDIFSKVERKLLSWIKMYWLRRMLPVVSALQSLPIHISKDPPAELEYYFAKSCCKS